MDDLSRATLKSVETPLRLTWVGLWAERLTRAFWPLWSLAGLTLLVALWVKVNHRGGTGRHP